MVPSHPGKFKVRTDECWLGRSFCVDFTSCRAPTPRPTSRGPRAPSELFQAPPDRGRRADSRGRVLRHPSAICRSGCAASRGCGANRRHGAVWTQPGIVHGRSDSFLPSRCKTRLPRFSNATFTRSRVPPCASGKRLSPARCRARNARNS